MNARTNELIRALECQQKHQTDCKLMGCKYYHAIANLCMTTKIMTDSLEFIKAQEKNTVTCAKESQ